MTSLFSEILKLQPGYSLEVSGIDLYNEFVDKYKTEGIREIPLSKYVMAWKEIIKRENIYCWHIQGSDTITYVKKEAKNDTQRIQIP